MTTFNNEINRIFKEMSRSFGSVDDIFEALQNTNGASGPIYYGYTMTVGPDGRPVIQEYGNVKPDSLPTTDACGCVEKTDVKVFVDEDIVHIDAKHGEKDYHVNVPIHHKVDSDSPKATYTNGILELTFDLDTKPSGRSVDVL